MLRPHGGVSNKYPQHMFLWRNKKKNLCGYFSYLEQNRTEQNFINLTTSQATRRKRKRRKKKKKQQKTT